MKITDTPPEQLSERELFEESDESREGYSKARLHARRADLLAEIGERLEALEAAKALISDTGSERDAAP